MFAYLHFLSYRQIKSDHVGWLRWHKAKECDVKGWIRQISLYRKDFKFTKNTRVCSNHFSAGYYSDHCNIPTLHMKGYDTEPFTASDNSQKRKEPVDRTLISPPPKRSRYVVRNSDDPVEQSIEEIQTPHVHDHNYDLTRREGCARCTPSYQCLKCCEKEKTIRLLEEQIETQKEEIGGLKKDIHVNQKNLTIDDLKNSKLILVYTGLQSIEVFEWLYNRIKAKAGRLMYRKTAKSKLQKRNGKKRKLSTRDEFFLTLVRLRLGLTEWDLAYRFKVSQSTISSTLSTWIPFLARELAPFIAWPTQEQNKQCYPKCFSKYPNTIGIIDCTEGALEKPSLAKAQAQTYSSYESKNTWKKLISFLSSTYGGSASDRHITESCKLLKLINPGDVLMADKGFNISDLLVGRGVKLVIPPFLKDKVRFAKENCVKTSTIAKARIHVE